MPHDVQINANLTDLQSAAQRLKTDSAERERLQQDPVGYLSGLGIQIGGETANAVRQSSARTASAPKQAAIVHIDA